MTNEKKLTNDEKLVKLADEVIFPLKGLPLSYAKMVLQTAIQRAERKAVIPD